MHAHNTRSSLLVDHLGTNIRRPIPWAPSLAARRRAWKSPKLPLTNRLLPSPPFPSSTTKPGMHLHKLIQPKRTQAPVRAGYRSLGDRWIIRQRLHLHSHQSLLLLLRSPRPNPQFDPSPQEEKSRPTCLAGSLAPHGNASLCPTMTLRTNPFLQHHRLAALPHPSPHLQVIPF